MCYGVEILPEGRRKRGLYMVLQRVLDFYAKRVLVFDRHAAGHYAEIAANAKLAGRTLPIVDGYIAAMAAARGYAVASRDVGPFTAAGLEVINPWL
jgi:predicted nucleic acid-binding protein